MIAILSIIVPVIIFLIVLWIVAIIQKHWARKERETLERTTAANRTDRREESRVCGQCGASGPDVMFINRLCLNCYEQQRAKEQSEDFERERRETSVAMARYYRILGCSEQDSDQEVKRQYHKRAKELHPDSLLGQDLPEELTKRRTAEFQRLQEAYSKVIEQRTRRG